MAYSTRDDLELLFGKTNLCRWADVDNKNDADTIDARITWACLQADTELDERLVDGPYEIPFTGTIPTSVVRESARMAGIILYDSRGLVDADPGEDILTDHRKMFEKWVNQVLSHQRKISGATLTATRSYPDVVTDSGS